MNIYLGIDMSLAHAGVVKLDEAGHLIDYLYIGRTTKEARKSTAHGLAVPAHIGKMEPDMRGLYRLRWLAETFTAALGSRVDGESSVYVAMEDYAFGKGFQAHQIGEVAGIVRLYVAACWNLRLHAPTSLKLFVTGRGDASKEEVCGAAWERWSEVEEFERYEAVTRQDLTEAYALAHLARLEVELRAGRILLSSLPESTVQVFNRVTRRHPTNVLARPWIRLATEPDREAQDAT